RLPPKYRNICVVGDADQGVYSWRGATIQNLLDFERDYPDAAVFLMEQNYRSTQNILAVANALIEHNVQRKPKSLWTAGPHGELAVRYRADNEHEESGFVAQEIDVLGTRAKGAVAGFVGVMDSLAAHLAEGRGPSRMVEFANDESGYVAELESERTVEAEGRVENLRELVGVAAEFEARNPDGG